MRLNFFESLCAACRCVSVFAVHHRLSRWLHLQFKSIPLPSTEAELQWIIFIHDGSRLFQTSVPAAQHPTLVWSEAQHVDQHLPHCGHHEGRGSDVQRLRHECQEAADVSGDDRMNICDLVSIISQRYSSYYG